MKIFKKVILPLGYKANGITCGIKKSGRADLALFYSGLPAKTACLFTTNKIQAAPIHFNKRQLKVSKSFQAIITNSGNANCFTGGQGINDAQEAAVSLAQELGIKKEAVLVNSTGVIGKRLPLGKIKRAIPGLVKGLSLRGIIHAKQAILTTDTFAKEITARFYIGTKAVTISGVAKGAGMISPNMATMLSFILTDANISQAALVRALKISVDSSFNCITVDGCMSTNDSVMMLANGAAGNSLIGINKNYSVFTEALSKVCLELAKMVVKDAEGATKFIQIKVARAKSALEAKRVALAIANSNLFKTTVYGENKNFGRIVAAAGASTVGIKEEDLNFKVSPLNRKNINVEVYLGQGIASATVYTSDLTPEYIKINARYN